MFGFTVCHKRFLMSVFPLYVSRLQLLAFRFKMRARLLSGGKPADLEIVLLFGIVLFWFLCFYIRNVEVRGD